MLLRLACALLTLTCLVVSLSMFRGQALRRDASSATPPSNDFHNSPRGSKVALLVETRPLPHLAPLLLHFAAVLPPAWRILFLGSPSSLQLLRSSAAVRSQVRVGRFDLQPFSNTTALDSPEQLSRFLTSLDTYSKILPPPAEWILVFQADSMICGNAAVKVEDYLGYDWVGAPWDPNGECGGNGGLSLRRASKIRQVLGAEGREDHAEPEDVWFSRRLCQAPGVRMANGSVGLTFSGEMYSGPVTRPEEPVESPGSFYEPMGYHTGGSGSWLHGAIWGTPELRNHIYRYCPEVKMMLKMDLAQYTPGECRSEWTD